MAENNDSDFLIVLDAGDEDQGLTLANDISGIIDGNWKDVVKIDRTITDKNFFKGAKKVFVLNDENILAIQKALPHLWISAAEFHKTVREAKV
jgi:hypothetical protein